MSTTPTEAQYEAYQTLLREKYDREWTLSAVLGKFKSEPTAAVLAEATAVMEAHVAHEAKLVEAAAVCGIQHGRKS